MAATINLITLSNSIREYVPVEKQQELLDEVQTLSDILDANTLMKSTKAKSIIPPGTIFPYAGKTTPEDFLLCDGRAVSRTEYEDLFNAIGTTYGSGNGSTTFNLPNLVSKFVEGSTASETGTNMAAGLPNIGIGSNSLGGIYMDVWATNHFQTKGCFKKGATGVGSCREGYAANAGSYAWIELDLTNGINSIYGKSDTVQPPAIKMQYIIHI